MRDARPPLGVQILSISCSFRENLACSRPPWRVHAPPRENPGSATADSTRATASSSAAKKTRSLELVLKMGNWRSESTFFKHYLRQVKYFKRNQKSQKSADQAVKEFPFTPADGLLTQARYSLKRAIKRGRNTNTTPYIELPPQRQGYDTGSMTSSLNLLEIPKPPSPMSSIASSAFTDVSMCEDQKIDPREKRLQSPPPPPSPAKDEQTLMKVKHPRGCPRVRPLTA